MENPLMQLTILLIASLWSILVCTPRFPRYIPVCFFFLFIFYPAESREDIKRSKKSSLSPFGVCLYVHHTSPLGREGSEGGCYVAQVHHSHLPVCQMSCLAELHTVMVLTKWQEGGTLQWMSIWLRCTEAPMLPHTKTDKIKKGKIGEERRSSL